MYMVGGCGDGVLWHSSIPMLKVARAAAAGSGEGWKWMINGDDFVEDFCDGRGCGHER